MADACLHPLQRETGVYFPSGRWPIRRESLHLIRPYPVCIRARKILHNSAPDETLCHCRVLFLFLRNDRTSTKFFERDALLLSGRRTSFLSVLFFSQSDIRSSFTVVKEHLVFRRDRRIQALFQPIIHLLVAGYVCCLKFVSEERNEVCTDNLSLLWNRMFI